MSVRPLTGDTGASGDLELLQIEITVLWEVDDQGRLRGPDELVLAAATNGITAAVAHSVPGDLAAALLDTVGRATLPPATAQPPAAIQECRALLAQAAPGRLVLSGGPSYLLSPPIRYERPAVVLRSDSPDAASVRGARPDNWEPDEWEELVTGGTGAPWAMIIDHGRVATICHTPRRSAIGAEAGTWTDPEYRGRGYAAAATAAWADLLAGSCPYLFYSTSTDNHSSQRVAERLRLRHLGWLWKLSRTSAVG